MHNRLQHLVDIEAGLGGNARGVGGVQADHILDLRRHVIRIRTGQVNLVDHRKHIQVMVQGQIHIRQCLGLNALGGIHHQDGPVAGRQAPGHFIIKIHMSRRVDQVENVLISILRLVDRAHGLGLDGDAPLPLQIHVVQNLLLHLPAGKEPCLFNNSVCQGRLSVINVGDNTKIPYFALINSCHFLSSLHQNFIKIKQCTAQNAPVPRACPGPGAIKMDYTIICAGLSTGGERTCLYKQEGTVQSWFRNHADTFWP